MTRQRRVIYDIIRARPVHLTAEAIYEQAQERVPGIARGTVYRNLGLMVEAGEIRRIELAGGAACYDRTVAPHAHLICSRCAAVEDLMVENLTEKLSALTGEPVTDCDLIVYHVCKNCC